MNSKEEYHILAARPLSYVIFCCFLSTVSLSSNPILCIKKFFFALENGGVAGALPQLPTLKYCILILYNVAIQLATYIIKAQTTKCFCSHNQAPCKKSKNAITGQAFPYFARGMHLILKVKCIIRNTVQLKEWKF